MLFSAWSPITLASGGEEGKGGRVGNLPKVNIAELYLKSTAFKCGRRDQRMGSCRASILVLA